MKTVYLFLATGFEEIEAITPIDILRRAGVNLKTISITGNQTVMGAHNIPVTADLLFEEVDFNLGCMLILPGGMPGSTNLQAHKGLEEVIKTYVAEDKYLTAICAAPLVYGQLNLLQGKRATCYPGFEDQLLGAETSNECVVVDHKMITSRGPGTAAEFALKLVEILVDTETAAMLHKGMLIK